ncbi:MAG: zinc ribbon domain-containing protein, partial [Propionicimonas sp.]
MAICPAGHETSQTDFCDVCGLPVTAERAAGPGEPSAVAHVPPPTVACPNCQAPNVPEALFCEA